MRKMRKILLILIVVIWFPICCTAREAGGPPTEEEMADQLLEAYTDFYGDAFAKGMEDLEENSSFQELVPDFDVRKLLKQLVSGKLDLSFPALFQLLIQYLLGEVYGSLKLMALVLALSILCSYLTGLQEGFGKEGVSQAAFYVCYIVIAGIAAAAFYDAAGCVTQAVGNIATFMKMVVPIVITTLLTSGAIVSASVFEPALITIVEIAVMVIQTLFIPLVMISTAMNIVNNLSDQFKTQRMVKFMNQCVKWGLSIMLTVFVSVAGIQSIASAGADGLTVKLTKFAASNLIPVVGGILSESVETVMNCSVLIKNSVGVLGIICLAVIAVTPLLKIAAVLIIFRLTAAIAEPVSEPKIITCISELANSISVLFSMLAASTVMFIIVLTIVINAGNTAIMLGR